jgi:hypothetical protein
MEGAELLMNCATTSITMAPPVPSSTPPTTELAEMAASNAAVAGATSNVAAVAGATSNVAVVASATSNVAVAASATSMVATVVGGTGAVVGVSVLLATVLSPGNFILDLSKPTPSPSPYPTIIPKVQCPDAGAAMFAGYTVSNTSGIRQLFMVTLTDLPERLELFLTNSFSLPTMSEEFAKNATGSVKVRRNFILIYVERYVESSFLGRSNETCNDSVCSTGNDTSSEQFLLVVLFFR